MQMGMPGMSIPSMSNLSIPGIAMPSFPTITELTQRMVTSYENIDIDSQYSEFTTNLENRYAELTSRLSQLKLPIPLLPEHSTATPITSTYRAFHRGPKIPFSILATIIATVWIILAYCGIVPLPIPLEYLLSAWLVLEISFYFVYLARLKQLQHFSTPVQHSDQNSFLGRLRVYSNMLTTLSLDKFGDTSDTSFFFHQWFLGTAPRKSSTALFLQREQSTDSIRSASNALHSQHQNYDVQAIIDPALLDQKQKNVNLPTIPRGNMLQWVSWAMFSRFPNQLSVDESQECVNYITLLERLCPSLIFPHGFQPSIASMRLSLEQVKESLHRPLVSYYFVSCLQSVVKLILYYYLGFERKQIGGYHYWYRPRALNHLSEGRAKVDEIKLDRSNPPILFLHGIGHGLVYYLHFLSKLTFSHDVFLVELPFISNRFFEAPAQSDTIVSAIDVMLAEHNFNRAIFVGHSYGTFVTAWCLKFKPHLVHSVFLLDPVALLLCLPTTCHTFVYADCRSPMDWIRRLFVSSELTIVSAMRRAFYWSDMSLFISDLPKVRQRLEEQLVAISRDREEYGTASAHPRRHQTPDARRQQLLTNACSASGSGAGGAAGNNGSGCDPTFSSSAIHATPEDRAQKDPNKSIPPLLTTSNNATASTTTSTNSNSTNTPTNNNTTHNSKRLHPENSLSPSTSLPPGPNPLDLPCISNIDTTSQNSSRDPGPDGFDVSAAADPLSLATPVKRVPVCSQSDRNNDNNHERLSGFAPQSEQRTQADAQDNDDLVISFRCNQEYAYYPAHVPQSLRQHVGDYCPCFYAEFYKQQQRRHETGDGGGAAVPPMEPAQPQHQPKTTSAPPNTNSVAYRTLGFEPLPYEVDVYGCFDAVGLPDLTYSNFFKAPLLDPEPAPVTTVQPEGHGPALAPVSSTGDKAPVESPPSPETLLVAHPEAASDQSVLAPVSGRGSSSDDTDSDPRPNDNELTKKQLKQQQREAARAARRAQLLQQKSATNPLSAFPEPSLVDFRIVRQSILPAHCSNLTFWSLRPDGSLDMTVTHPAPGSCDENPSVVTAGSTNGTIQDDKAKKSQPKHDVENSPPTTITSTADVLSTSAHANIKLSDDPTSLGSLNVVVPLGADSGTDAVAAAPAPAPAPANLVLIPDVSGPVLYPPKHPWENSKLVTSPFPTNPNQFIETLPPHLAKQYSTSVEATPILLNSLHASPSNLIVPIYAPNNHSTFASPHQSRPADSVTETAGSHSLNINHHGMNHSVQTNGGISANLHPPVFPSPQYSISHYSVSSPFSPGHPFVSPPPPSIQMRPTENNTSVLKSASGVGLLHIRQSLDCGCLGHCVCGAHPEVTQDTSFVYYKTRYTDNVNPYFMYFSRENTRILVPNAQQWRRTIVDQTGNAFPIENVSYANNRQEILQHQREFQQITDSQLTSTGVLPVAVAATAATGNNPHHETPSATHAMRLLPNHHRPIFAAPVGSGTGVTSANITTSTSNNNNGNSHGNSSVTPSLPIPRNHSVSSPAINLETLPGISCAVPDPLHPAAVAMAAQNSLGLNQPPPGVAAMSHLSPTGAATVPPQQIKLAVLLGGLDDLVPSDRIVRHFRLYSEKTFGPQVQFLKSNITANRRHKAKIAADAKKRELELRKKRRQAGLLQHRNQHQTVNDRGNTDDITNSARRLDAPGDDDDEEDQDDDEDDDQLLLDDPDVENLNHIYEYTHTHYHMYPWNHARTKPPVGFRLETSDIHLNNVFAVKPRGEHAIQGDLLTSLEHGLVHRYQSPDTPTNLFGSSGSGNGAENQLRSPGGSSLAPGPGSTPSHRRPQNGLDMLNYYNTTMAPGATLKSTIRTRILYHPHGTHASFLVENRNHVYDMFEWLARP